MIISANNFNHAYQYTVRNPRWLLLSWLLCLCFLTQAQDRRISGRVTESGGNTPLPGVNIVVKGTTTGMATDANGTYLLNVPASQNTLVFSAIGYISQEVNIGNRTEVNLTLDTDVRNLNEVVVTGYGAQTKRDITGAVATVDTKQLLSVPTTNVGQALQGRVAGVTVGQRKCAGRGCHGANQGFWYDQRQLAALRHRRGADQRQP